MLRIYILARRRRISGRDLGIILWPSFLAACAASLLFFATLDPMLLRDAVPRIFGNIDREGGYALGFLFFWMIAALASGTSVFLIRTAKSTSGTADPSP